MTTARYIALFLLLCLHPALVAQQYYFEHYSAREGLAQSRVYTTFQDSMGYVWIGTPSGVSRFDGHEFVNYSTADNLADGGVQAIAAQGKGLWMGHVGGGLSYWDGKRFSKITLPVELNGDINDMLVDRHQRIWLATIGAGAIRISNVLGANKKVEQFRGGEGLSDRVYRITETHDGSLYFIIDGGIKTWDAELNDFNFFRPDGLDFSSQFTELFEDNQKRLWLGTYTNGLYCFDPTQGSTRYFGPQNGLAHNFVTSIAQDQRGTLWAGTYNGGLARIQGDSAQSFGPHNGLNDNVIRSLQCDREGNLLIGTANSGLAIYKGEQFVAYNENFGLPGSQVNAILHHGPHVYFGTDKGLLVWNRLSQRKDTYTSRQGLLSNDVFLLKKDRNDRIWVACKDGGVVLFDPTTQRIVQVPNANASHASQKIRAMDIDHLNRLWIGTWDGVLCYQIDTDQYQLYSQADGLTGNDIRSIYHDGRGRVWFGAVDKGACYLQGERFVPIQVDTALHIANYSPSDFALDSIGQLWVGTEDDGLLLWDGKRITRQYRIEQGLLSNYISSLEIDRQQRVWIGTGAGLNLLHPERNSIRFYTAQSGFTGIEVRPKASSIDAQGNIWFGTTKGVNVFNAAHEEHASLEPLTRINRLRINLKDREWQPEVEIKLRHTEYAVFIDYSAIWLSNPDAVRYKVMLEGLDQDWQPETRSTEINYPYLKPGHYVFKVMARNHQGVWNEVPAQISFYISPPIWQRPWFIALALALGTALVYGYIRLRESGHRKERIKLERIVQERTTEIAQKNKQLAQQNRDVMDSIRYAKRIQTAVMPSKEYMQANLPEHFLLFRPRDIVSGDYYWMAKVDHRFIVAAVDCTGHGVPGALLSMLGVSSLNEIVSKGHTHTAAEMLDQLRDYVIRSLRQTGEAGSSHDGMDMTLCIVDPHKRELQFAGANNPMFFFRNNQAEVLKGDSMPIGFYTRGDSGFTNVCLPYQAGDTFYIFSDGYVDQFGGPSTRKFMRKRFLELLTNLQPQPMNTQRVLLEEAFDNWRGTVEQIDDVLVIGVRLS